jgi:hypothetical protein
MELSIAAAWYALGKLTTEEAISAAHAALNRGVYSESLGELILAELRWSDVGPLLAKAFGELGIIVPDRTTAIRRLARHIARQIQFGEMRPFDGAHAIWRKLALELEAEASLQCFVGLASEWEDWPESRREYEADILRAARDLAESPEPEPIAVGHR